jgi:hypothetical protein
MAAENAFAAGTAGSYIESQLQTLISGCFGTEKYSKLFIPNDYISGNIKTNLDRPLDSQRTINDLSFDFLAKSIVDPNRSFVDQLTEPRNIRNQLVFELPPASPLQTISSSSYAFNCTTALKVAFDQGFSFNWTTNAIFKQSIQFQTDSGRSNSLLILYGAFRSPFDIAVTSIDNPGSSVAAHSAAWRYYIQNRIPQQQIKVTSKYLPVIRGWLLRWDTSGGMQTFLNSSLTAGASAWGLSANLGANATLQFNSKSAATSFSVILDQAIDPARDLAPLPEPADIDASIRNAATFSPQDAVPYIISIPTKITATIPGLPAWLCPNSWNASASDARIIVGNIKGSPNASATACELEVPLTLSAAVPSGSITFENQGFPIAITAASNHKVSFSKLFQFTQVLTPTPQLNGASKTTTIDASTFSVQVPFTILPKNGVKNIDLAPTASITCTDVSNADIRTYPSRMLPDAQGDLLMQVNFSYEKGVPPAPLNCAVTGNVSYVYSAPAGDAPLTRAINSSFSIPSR